MYKFTGSLMSNVKKDALSKAIYDFPATKACLMPMGITSENVVEKYGITR